MRLLADTSLVKGPTPTIIIVVALLSVIASLSWRDGGWKRQLVVGLGVSGVVIGIGALVDDAFALIPYQFPNSYYLWFGIVVFAAVSAVVGWRAGSIKRRVVSVVSVALTAVMMFVLVNQHYSYYPTVESVLGKEAAHKVTSVELQQAQDAARKSGVLPQHGFVLQVHIPGETSGFVARDAFVWLPPAWILHPNIKLPVLELLAGTPGNTSDWTRAGFADQISTEFANQHNGVAPILVMPDENGSGTGDTECVDSSLGNAETYLAVDVPKFMRDNFHTESGSKSFGIAGFSEGGFCSLMLSLRHTDVYAVFGDYAGLTSPTLGESVDAPATIKSLFAGNTDLYNQHDPLYLLANNSYKGLSGWFEVGTSDSGPLAAQRQLVPLATKAGISTCYSEISGNHSYEMASQSFKDSLPWMSAKLNLTPMPANVPATCSN